MTKKILKKALWQKKGTTRHPAVNKFMITKNLTADNILLPYDVKASIAHAKMLAKVGLLTKKESSKIVEKLNLLAKLHKEKKVVLDDTSEDVHTFIEAFLTKELGAIGKKVHMGRSRNDQVLVATRLYVLDLISQTEKKVSDLISKIIKFAKKYEFIPMCGYTHYQRAMPSSVGQWAMSVAESLLDDKCILHNAYDLYNQNPLGSAAGFGSIAPIDRKETTKLLNFAKTQINPIYCQNSRGKFASFTISTLVQIMITIDKMANDLIIFTTKEFDFFKVDNCLTTGSSIMPQKRNMDILEVMRANLSIVQSLQIQTQTVGMNLLSGYNKDSKITKEALVDSFDIVKATLNMALILFDYLEPKEENLIKAFKNPEIFATDYAYELVIKGMPFRDAYVKVGNNLDSLKKTDPYKNIKSKKHLGATGNLGIKIIEQRLKKK